MHPQPAPWQRWLLTTLKVVLPLAVIGWLLSRIKPEQLELLRSQPKDWGLLTIAFFVAFSAVSLTFVRWWLLVRTLNLPFRLSDAFRLGFLGYLLNFVSVGAVGGDLFKAVFIAREQPGRRGEAVATVLVDRVIGLYALLLVASAAILTGAAAEAGPAVGTLCNATLAGTVVGAIGIVVVLLPTVTGGRFSGWAASLPWVGTAVGRVIAGVRLYKSRPGVMILIAVMSVAVHSLLSLAIWLIASAIFSPVPNLAEHLVIVPLSMVAGALPFTPGGLGGMELVMNELYRLVPAGEHPVSGVLVALVYRLVTIAIAAVGAVFYFRKRAEVAAVMEEAEAA